MADESKKYDDVMTGEVISNDAITCAVYMWAETTWLYDYAHVGDDQYDENQGSAVRWLEIQLKEKEKIFEMTPQELDALINQHEKRFRDSENVVELPGTADELYEQAATIWADIKWWLILGGEVNYPQDTTVFEADQWQELEERIEKAGGEEKFYEQHK